MMQTRYRSVLTTTASQLYTENTLNDLMQITVYNGIAIRKYKIESLWAKASDSKNIFSHAQLHVIIFDHPGKNINRTYRATPH